MRPIMEDLEHRLVLSQVSPALHFTPDYVLREVPVPGQPGKFEPLQTIGPTGYTPLQIQTAYGLSTGSVYNNNIFGGIGDGAGQTIAVIDVGDNTGFLSFTGGAGVGALHAFDQQFGLPDPPSFQKYNQDGGTTNLPPPNPGWGTEIALDVEWSHAMAPDAKIDLVEATSSANDSLFQAAYTAATTLGASVVSMSFGGSEGTLDQELDTSYIAKAVALNPTVTFLASTGDHGSAYPAPPGGPGPGYPSTSPNVVAVGGTTLNINGSSPGPYTWGSETGWSYGSDVYCNSCAGGGGISSVFNEPSWQEGVQQTGFRTVPDVSSDADPNTGVAVYDPTDLPAGLPWIEVGGTSLSSPTWAGFIAIADQGRNLMGAPDLGGPTQTLPALYSLPSSDFHDIKTGYNGYYAGPGYDLVTGLGSPKANLLLPQLAAYGLGSQAVLTTQPPSSVIADGQFGTIVSAEDTNGIVDTGFSGSATISLESGPAGATFTPVTVPFSDGLAVFDGLSLSQLSNGTDYVFQISVNKGTTLLTTLTSDNGGPNPVDVATAANPTVGVYYPLPVDSSLHRDINLADSDNFPTDNIYLVYSTPFQLTSGELLIQNTSPQSSKTISILGQGEATSVITAGQTSRVFDIVGTTSTLTVEFKDLSVEGGYASDNGGLNLPGTVVGGGLLIDGGNVTMSSVSVNSNLAVGSQGSFGFPGGSLGSPGNNGGNGGKAEGGGFYVAAGSLTLNNDTFSDNRAQGGTGGAGGVGRAGYTITPSGLFASGTRTGGSGGAGGKGGAATGGGGFVAKGTLVLAQDVFQSNSALGGIGGVGGTGGQGGFFSKPGGNGGNGGAGGPGNGGGLYIAQGTISLTNATFDQNSAVGGNGGVGRPGGPGGPTFPHYFPGTASGSPGITGVSGVGGGGGLYVTGGTITWNSGTIENNTAGFGGGFYNAAILSFDGYVEGNVASTGSGGGIWNAQAGTLTLTGASISNNTAASNGGGVYNIGTLVDDNTSLTDNNAQNGSGGGIGNAGNATIENNSSFDGNSAGLNGGAIFNSAKQTLIVTDSTFTGNSNVAGAGGGIYNLGNLTLGTSTFTDNASAPDSQGGGVWNGGTPTVADTIAGTIFTGNSASFGYGGAIYNNAPLSVVNSTFSTNTAQGGFGGAVMNDVGGALTLTNNTFTGNTAYEGGGLFSQSTIAAAITGDTFNANIANDGSSGPFGFGGAIYNNALMTITNSTLANNTSAFAGGGIYNNSGTLTLIYVTIAYNSDGSAENTGIGGGLDANGGTVTLYDSLLALNTNNFTTLPDDISTLVGGTISPSSAYNLIGSGGSGGLTDGTNGNIVVSPGTVLDLGQLADNGGPTDTIALLAGSPAIDMGSTSIPGVTFPAVDQRGAERGPAGLNAGPAPDIGAYEASSSFLVTNTLDTLVAGSLASAISWANSSTNANPENLAPNTPAPNTIRFDTAGVFSTPQTITLTNGTLQLTNTTTAIAIDGPGASIVDINFGPITGSDYGDFEVLPGVTATLSGLTITGGSAVYGGAVDNSGTLTVTQSLITGGDASSGGGISSIGSLTVMDTTFTSNTAGSIGGGIYSVGTLEIVDGTFSGNKAGGAGGGIFSQGTLSILDSSLSSNTASGAFSISGGGGIFYSSISSTGSAAVTGSTFSGNTATNGGAIFVSLGTLTLTDSSLTSNTATNVGGGIENAATVVILDSTLANNSANAGGGLDNPGNATLTNATIAGNSATGQGGGIESSGTLTAVNVTIAYNSVASGGSGGGGLIVVAGTTTLDNSIVVLNTFGTSPSDISGTATGSYNLIGTGGDGGLGGTNHNQVNVSSASLNLGPLGNNGGPTETIALLTGSVAIDAGSGTISGVNVPITDQRGALRGGSGGIHAGTTPDVGAYEASSSFLVTNTLDAFVAGSLRTAVSWANGNINDNPENLAPNTPAPNTILFDTSGVFATPQTITLTPSLGTLALNDATTGVTIEGPGVNFNDDYLVTIDGGNAVGVFSVATGVNASLTGLTISDGLAASGGGINNSGILTVSNSIVSNSSATGSGGGVENEVGATLTISDSTISGSTAVGSGGGIDNAGTLVLDDSTITSNASTGNGGGIDNEAGATMTLTGSTISTNTTKGSGGGIDNLGPLTLDGSTIENNTATGGDGGGIYNFGPLVGENDTISGNAASDLGGGIYNEIDTVTITAGTISGNSAASGGGIFNSAGTVTIASINNFSTNTVTGSGGGIDNVSGSLTISYSTLSANTAGVTGTTVGSGGGIENGGTLVVNDSTLAGNSAVALGGGIDNLGGTTTLTNDTLAGNSALNGGGISDSGTLSAVNVTIAYNTVYVGGDGGGLYVGAGGLATLDNTIVALNTLGTGVSAPSNSIGLSGGSLSAFSANNLIGTGGTGGLVNGINGNRVNVASNLMFLGTLAPNGGPTQTIALLAGSPAIDGGATTIAGVSIPTVDERGALRGPAGLNAGSTVDIGAYEASSSYLVTTTVDSTAVGSIRAAIGWTNLSTNANPENLAPNKPAPNTVVFGIPTTDPGYDPTTASWTITLSPTFGPLVLTDTNPAGMAIAGPGQGVTISGGNVLEVFQVLKGVTATLSGLTISGGFAASSGGGILNEGSLTVDADTITGNSAQSGGGIYNESGGTLTVLDTTVSGNTAAGVGGGIANTGTATITNSTIAGNMATSGGGIFVSGGVLTTVNATIAYNTEGGGIDVTGGTVTLDNTIVALNPSGAAGTDITGTVSGSYNLIGTGGSGGLTSGTNGNQVGVADPGLAAALADNGGPTETIALLPDSPAIQTGSSIIAGVTVPTTDQRGALRNPEGLNGGKTVDVGAYELSSSYLVSTAADLFTVGSLRSAIAWANVNVSNPLNPVTNTILFSTTVFSPTSPQTITLSPSLGTLDLTNTTSPTVIDGPGASVATISGAGLVGVFLVDSGVTATVSGLTLTDGTATVGGAFDNSGNLTVLDSTLVNNGATQNGGAIYNNLGTLTITDTTLSNNSTIFYGGGIYNYGGTVTISGATIEGNSSTYGIGGGLDNTGFTTTVTSTKGTTTTTTTATMTITNSTIKNNLSFYGGGINNSSTGNLTITNTTIQNNTGTLGGGIWNDGTLSVSASTIADNLAVAGGGISNNLPGTLMLVNSTIAGNTATQYGGGIDNVGIFTAVNDTIAYNVVASGGAGGGLVSTAGTASLYNTIVVDNYLGSTGGSAGDIAGTVATTSAYNLIGIGGSGGLTNDVNGNQVGVASSFAALGKLAANGGPTETIALLTGSTAIGAGSSTIPGVTVPTTDQRGEPRPAPPASIDIGAYQTQPPVIVPVLAPTVVATKPLDPSVATSVSTNATVVAPSVSISVSGVATPVAAPHAVKKVIGKGRPKPNGGSAGVFHKTTHKVATKHVSIAAKHVNIKQAKK